LSMPSTTSITTRVASATRAVGSVSHSKSMNCSF
jgi:hypothetical protein